MFVLEGGLCFLLLFLVLLQGDEFADVLVVVVDEAVVLDVVDPEEELLSLEVMLVEEGEVDGSLLFLPLLLVEIPFFLDFLLTRDFRFLLAL